MGKRGPKKQLNRVRKWWNLHKITVEQLEELLDECKKQLPVLENELTMPTVLAALVAEKHKLVEAELFDAAEFLRACSPDSEHDEEEVAPAQAAG